MSNEVEITVKSKDKTDFTAMKAKAKAEGGKAGDQASDAFGRATKRGSEKSGKESGKSFGSSLKRWFAGEGGGLFTEIGKSGGTVFGSGLLGALKTPILGPALVGILGAVVATVMPAIGAVAGGALVTGFGAGIAGLGILFAAKSEAVGNVWKRTLGQLGADMRLLSKPFENTLINIASYFQRTVDKFNPVLAKAFAKMAPMVDKFVDGAARSFEQLAPAIGPITDAFGEVLRTLGPAVDSVIRNLAQGMTELSLSIQKNPSGLADLVSGVGSLVGEALHLITILNDVNGGFERMTGGLSLVDVTIGMAMGPIIALSASFSVLGKVIDLANAALGRTGKDSDTAGQSMSDAAKKTAELAAGINKTADAAHGVVAPAQTMAEKLAETKKKAAEARQAFEDLITNMFRFQNLALSLSGAQIGLQAALDNATKSAKENGKTLNINTEKGRANQAALNGVAQAANAQSEAMIRSGKGTSAAGLAAEKSRANFVKIAMQMGVKNKAAAEAMARSMIAIPNVTREARLTANKKDLDTKLKAAQAQLNDKGLTKERRATLSATITSLLRAKARAQAAIDALHGKTVTVFMNTIRTERRNIITSRSGLLDPGHWGGGTAKGYAGGGTPGPREKDIIVGENGPEKLRMSAGSFGRVTPAGNTKRQLQQEQRPQVIQLVFESSGNAAVDAWIKALAQGLKARGGDVQMILGGKRLPA